jgi:hypothetical protein
MRYLLISAVAVLMATIGWCGLYELTGQVTPDDPGALLFAFALLFLAVTATLAPAAAYLNRRIAPAAMAYDGLRFVRHSAWGGICIVVWAWLQMHRAFNVGFAVVTLLVFVAVEVLIIRLRGAHRPKS